MPIAGGAPPKGSPAACAAGKNPWIRRDCSQMPLFAAIELVSRVV